MFTPYKIELTIFSPKLFPIPDVPSPHSLSESVTSPWPLLLYLPHSISYQVLSICCSAYLTCVPTSCPLGFHTCSHSPLKTSSAPSSDKGCSGPALIFLDLSSENTNGTPMYKHRAQTLPSSIQSKPAMTWFLTSCSCSTWLIPSFHSHSVPCQMVILKHSVPFSTSDSC